LKNIECAKQLGSQSKLAVIKLGAEGAMLQNGDKGLFRPSISVNVVDTIGAGDSFDAGFLYGYLNHWELEKSLRLATICGALSTKPPGGTAAQPTLAERWRFYNDPLLQTRRSTYAHLHRLMLGCPSCAAGHGRCRRQS
jgi:sugar/nucleoside kinase (ribokinase family)